MNIPFTVEQFFEVFRNYNEAVWPAQILAYILGILAIALAWRTSKISNRMVSAILAVFWIWMGVFYHILHFSVINPAAQVLELSLSFKGCSFLRPELS